MNDTLPVADRPSIGRLILVPALITLGVTIARLAAELGGAPKWLANNAAGGPGALLGIAWLAPLFGIYFARRLHGVAHPYRALAKTLIAYGYAARIPVFLITMLAIVNHWDTHYSKFSQPGDPEPSLGMKILFTAIFQLGAWVFVWTLGTGMLTGSLTYLFLRRRRSAAIQPT